LSSFIYSHENSLTTVYKDEWRLKFIKIIIIVYTDTTSGKKLHRFIFAIALSELHLL